MNERQAYTELDNWSVVTRVCDTIEQGMDMATWDVLKRAHSLLIWPMKPDKWMVIIRFPLMAN